MYWGPAFMPITLIMVHEPRTWATAPLQKHDQIAALIIIRNYKHAIQDRIFSNEKFYKELKIPVFTL